MWCILISYPEIFLIQYIIDPTMNVVVQDLTEDIFLKGGFRRIYVANHRWLDIGLS